MFFWGLIAGLFLAMLFGDKKTGDNIAVLMLTIGCVGIVLMIAWLSFWYIAWGLTTLIGAIASYWVIVALSAICALGITVLVVWLIVKFVSRKTQR